MVHLSEERSCDVQNSREAGSERRHQAGRGERSARGAQGQGRPVRDRHRRRARRTHPADHCRQRCARPARSPSSSRKSASPRCRWACWTWATRSIRSPARSATPPKSKTTARSSAWRAAWASRPCIPIARDLHAAGNKVISIIGARTKDLLFWEDKMRAVSDELIICTDDGSYGRKALVTEPLKEMLRSRRPGRQGLGDRPDHHDEVRLARRRSLSTCRPSSA